MNNKGLEKLQTLLCGRDILKSIESIKREIITLRIQLHNELLNQKEGIISSDKVYELSLKLDKLILDYMKKALK